MREIHSLFSDSTPIDSEKFYDAMKNPEKYRKKLSTKAKKSYTTLKTINLEPAGHISFRFSSKDEKKVNADMERLEKNLRKKGITEVWSRGVNKIGPMWYGIIESLTIEVLSKY